MRLARRIVLPATLLLITFASHAQFPVSPNLIDENGNRTGHWTLWYDSTFNLVHDVDSVIFYRLIKFDAGVPSGKIRDFFRSGYKYWDGYSKSINPYVFDGESNHYYENGKVKYRQVYVNGNREGPCAEYYSNGVIQSEGQYHNDQQEGKWKYYHENGSLRIEISYINGNKTGPAKFYHPNGAVNGEGSYKDNYFEGVWTQYTDQGLKTEVTTYRKDTLEGVKEFFADGVLEERATYKRGWRNGTTTKYHSNGQIESTGLYVEGEKQGAWIHYFSNGKIRARGTKKAGGDDGFWEYFSENGQLNERGLSTAGLKQGEWKQWYDDGLLRQVSNYKNDTLEGRFISYHKNGKIESEGYKNRGQHSGYWKIYNIDGTLTGEGDYRNGLFEGTWKLYYDEGQLKAISNFHEGKWEGITTNYYVAGQISEVSYFKNGKRDSLYRGFHENGLPSASGDFKDDLKTGKWEWTYENGKTSGVSYYVEGRETGITYTWFPNGALKFQGERVNDQLTGRGTFNFQNGKLKETGTYAAGKFDGKWTDYDSATGKITNVSYFSLGKRNGTSTSFDNKGKKTGVRYYIHGWEETRSNIRDSVMHLINIRDYASALKVMKWLESVEKRDYKDPKLRILSMHIYARVYSAMADYQKAYEWDMKYLKAVAKYEGTNTENYRVSLHNIANGLHGMEKYDEALKYYGEALEATKPAGLGQSYWATLSNIAYCYYDAGRHAEAAAAFEEELAKANKLFGPDSSAAWYLRREAAEFYYDRPDDYDRSAKLYQELLDDIITANDVDNAFVFDCNFRLGMMSYNQFDRNADAIKPLTDAIAYAERNHNTDIPRYGEALRTLFYIYTGYNQLDTAIASRVKSISGKLKNFAEGARDHNARAEALLALGNNSYNLSDYPTALEYFHLSEKEFINAGKANSQRHASVLQSLAFATFYVDRLKASEAEQYFVRAVNIKKELLDRKSPSYYNSVRQLAAFYGMTEKFDTAIGLLQDVITISREEDDKESIARSEQALGEMYFSKWQYTEAIPYFTAAITFYETREKDFASPLVNTLGYLSSCYKYKARFDDAIATAKKAMAIAERYFTRESDYYYYRVASLAGVYETNELFTEALKYSNEAAVGLAGVYGEHSTRAIDQQINSILIWYKLSENKKVIEMGEKLLTTIRSLFTENSDQYLALAYVVALAYDNILKYPEAEKGFLSAVAASKVVNGTSTHATAIHMIRLGKFYDRVNRLDEAYIVLDESVAIMRGSGFSAKAVLASHLGDLANVLAKLDKNKEAEALYLEGVALTEPDSANNMSIYVDAALELSRFYSKVGRFKEAEARIQKTTAMIDRREGKRYYYAQSRHDLVYMYYRLGRYDEAKVEATSLLALVEEAAGQDHWLVLRLHNYLGIIYDDLVEYENAAVEFKFCIDATERRKDLSEVDKASLATYYSNLARTELCLAKYTEAGNHLQEALRIRKVNNVKEGQVNAASTLSNLASYYQAIGKMDQAEATWNKLNQSLLSFSMNNFYFMSDEEKAQFWRSINGYFSIFQSFAVQRAKQNPAIIAEMYNVQLATKAILLSASNKIRKRILSSRDTSMVNMYYKWTRKREQLAQLYSSGNTGPQYKASVDSLETTARLLEKDMNISAEDLSKDKGGETITWKSVQAQLGPDEAAVEIVRFKHYDRYLRDSVIYAAMVLTSETKQYPKIVILNDGKQLEGRYLKYYRNSIASQNIDSLTYAQYWAPLNGVLKNKTRIYLSLDGVYNQININTLMNSRGEFLVEDKNLTILSNTKDLIAIKSRKYKRMSLSSATLFGFPTYFLGKEKVKEGVSKTREFDTAALDDNDRTGISPLIGTQEEIRKVGSILEAHKIHASVFTNEMASEHELKQLQHPRVLHIATHGFFVEEQSSALAIASGSESNPLLRAGLLLAGASNFIQNRVRLDEENGILTAYEAANLDLDNTDLVVLSACETGKGQVQNGEGVYGLQRAFQTAGAQTIVMSLWKVDDEATQQLMTSFYTNWMGGMTKAEALKNAQVSLKKQFPHPYYWGAFVMLEN